MSEQGFRGRDDRKCTVSIEGGTPGAALPLCGRRLPKPPGAALALRMTSTANARRATPADLPEIRRVVNLAYQVEAFFIEGDRITPAELQARFANAGAEFLVIDAPEPGRLSAAVHFEDRGDHGWFGLLAVDPASQGAGHARTLLMAMESRCRSLGLPRLQLEMVDLRRELPAFYAKFGFTERERKPFPNGEKLKLPAEMIVMGKQVNGDQ